MSFLSQDQQISCFVSGLQDSARANVQAGKPMTLFEAIRPVGLYETHNLTQGPFKLPEAQNSSMLVPIKMVSTKRIDKRRKDYALS